MHYALVAVVWGRVVFSAEECRERAGECLRVAQLTPDDLEANQGWLQLSEVWLRLADELDGHLPRPARVWPKSDRVETVKVADVLRQRLALGEPAETPGRR